MYKWESLSYHVSYLFWILCTTSLGVACDPPPDVAGFDGPWIRTGSYDVYGTSFDRTQYYTCPNQSRFESNYDKFNQITQCFNETINGVYDIFNDTSFIWPTCVNPVGKDYCSHSAVQSFSGL